MALSLVDVGTTANDGTGDPLRTAFQTVNTAITAVNNAVVVGTGTTTFKDDSGSTGVTVLADGKVGINTVAPTEYFHVAGNAYVTNTLGVGSVPKTWSGNWRGVQIGQGASFAGLVANNTAYVFSNLYAGGSGVQYNNAGTGGQLAIAGNQLIFSVATTGVADAVATLTEVFRVNASGDFAWQNAGATVGMTYDASTDSNAGGLGIRTAAPTGALDVNDDKIRVRTAKTPASAAATGNAGDICWDASYIYVCTATNTWKRVAIATW